MTKFLSFGHTTLVALFASEESSTVASEDGVVASEDGVVVSEQSPTDVSVYTALALWYELIGYRITDVDGKWTVSLFFMDIDSNPTTQFVTVTTATLHAIVVLSLLTSCVLAIWLM